MIPLREEVKGILAFLLFGGIGLWLNPSMSWFFLYWVASIPAGYYLLLLIREKVGRFSILPEVSGYYGGIFGILKEKIRIWIIQKLEQVIYVALLSFVAVPILFIGLVGIITNPPRHRHG